MRTSFFVLLALGISACGGGVAGEEQRPSADGTGAPGGSAPAPGTPPSTAPSEKSRFTCEPSCTPTTLATAEYYPTHVAAFGSRAYWLVVGGAIRTAAAGGPPKTLVARAAPDSFAGLGTNGTRLFATGLFKLDQGLLESVVSVSSTTPPASIAPITTWATSRTNHGILGPVGANGLLYYVHHDSKSMHVVAVSEGGATSALLTMEGESAYHLAVGDTNVYLGTTDSSGNVGHVLAVPKASGSPTTLAVLTGRPVALAAKGASVYWAEYDAKTIRRLDDAGAATTVATSTGIPEAIAVDDVNVYWLTLGTPGQKSGALYRKGHASSDVVELVSGLPSPSSIAVTNEAIYWTNLGTSAGNFNDGSVMRLAR